MRFARFAGTDPVRSINSRPGISLDPRDYDAALSIFHVMV